MPYKTKQKVSNQHLKPGKNRNKAKRNKPKNNKPKRNKPKTKTKRNKSEIQQKMSRVILLLEQYFC